VSEKNLPIVDTLSSSSVLTLGDKQFLSIKAQKGSPFSLYFFFLLLSERIGLGWVVVLPLSKTLNNCIPADKVRHQVRCNSHMMGWLAMFGASECFGDVI
jgi:hypothetical protein